MAFLIGGANTLSSGFYQVSNSFRFEENASHYMYYLADDAGSSATTGTISCWVKFTTQASDQYIFSNSNEVDGSQNIAIHLRFDGDGKLQCEGIGANITNFSLVTAGVYRDPHAWYHLVLRIDSTQATAANRLILYVNGEQVALGTYNAPDEDSAMGIGTDGLYYSLSRSYSGVSDNFEGYIAEFHYTDGVSNAPTAFGEYEADSGMWRCIEYEGSYGNHGHFLQFKQTGTSANSSGMGADTSGNDHHYTLFGSPVADNITQDSPTNNFAHVSSIGPQYVMNEAITNFARITKGGLEVNTRTGGTGDGNSISTQPVPRSGKWYMEYKVASDDGNVFAGLSSPHQTNHWVVYYTDGTKTVNNSGSAYGDSFGNGDVIGIAVDRDNNNVYFSKNGTFQNSGDPTSGATGTGAISYDFDSEIASGAEEYFWRFADGGGTTGPVLLVNFGNPVYALDSANSDTGGIGSFEYAVPSGYYAVCSKNIATNFTTIDDPSAYFQTTLYTGNGGADHAITNGGNSDLQPDWVWIKNRDAADAHMLFDSTRGVTKSLSSDATAAEVTDTDTLDAFQSDGFRVDADVKVNTNAEKYVAWQWKANGGTTSTLSGGISATVQADTTAGFSIVKFAASDNNNQVEHGLGAEPYFIIAKGKDVTDNWFIYHKSTGANGYQMLNTTAAFEGSNATVWRNITPTSQYFYVSTGGFNDDSTDVIAYCFAPIQGYSKFGSYTGNGNANGPFIYTGFKPTWIMVKRTDSTSNWQINDNKRDVSNVSNTVIYPNVADAEGTDTSWDVLSNGFKMRQSFGSKNASGSIYVYMAFAESPFVTSTGVPATAR
tara:strand:- start:2120 stop:4603 length:2484 start_codon:yes stop_codon:yes gene_type:complete